MIKKIVSASVGVAVWVAIAAEGVRPQAELLGSVEFASFSAFQQKVVNLGATINNPVVSMMACPAVQNALTEKFGRFRQDETILLLCYADTAALRKALDADVGGAGEEEHLNESFTDTAGAVACGLGGSGLDAVGAVALAEEGLGGFVVRGEVDVEVRVLCEFAVYGVEEEFIGTGVDGGLIVCATDMKPDGMGCECSCAGTDLLLDGRQGMEE